MEANDENELSQVRNALHQRRRVHLAGLLFLGIALLKGMGTHLRLTYNHKTLLTLFTQNTPDEPLIQLTDFKLHWSSIAFSVAVTLAAIPAGLLTYKFPAKILIAISVGGSAALHCLLPFVIGREATYVIVINVVKGLLEALSFPAIHALWRYWSPPPENTSFGLIAAFGGLVGYAWAELVFYDYVPYSSWSICYYGTGALGLGWMVFWLFTSSEKPSLQLPIQSPELQYLRSSIGDNETTPNKIEDIPWCSILTSFPVLAILMASFCSGWNLLIIINVGPNILINLHGINEEGKNSIMISYFFMALMLIVTAAVVDCVQRRYEVSTTSTRKIVTCGGLIAFGVTIAFVGIDIPSVTVLHYLCYGFACTFYGISLAGFMANHLDIARRHAGLLMGMTIAIENLAYIIYPIYVYIHSTLNNKSLEEIHKSNLLIHFAFSVFNNDSISMEEPDRANILLAMKNVFMMVIVFNVVGGLFCAIFASGEKQSWADESSADVHLTNEYELRPNCDREDSD